MKKIFNIVAFFALIGMGAALNAESLIWVVYLGFLLIYFKMESKDDE